MKLILEQRYLFDGSVGAIGHHGAHADIHDPLHPPEHAAAIGAEEVPGAASRPAPPDPARAAAANITTVLIVDSGVANWQSLVAGAKPGVDVVVLDPAKDGITQVSQALQGLTGVKNLEFLTNGTPGAIALGGSTLNLATLTSRASDISAWSASLTGHADIVFWGCDVGLGSAGAAFVGDMHTLTGATIGASSDATGAAALGGNWNVEVTTGHLHDGIQPFSAVAVAGFSGILDTPDPSVTLGVTGAAGSIQPGSVFLGDTLHVSMSFSNPALNATGYGPFIELFAPAALTMTGAPSSSGASISPLTAAVAADGSFRDPLTGVTEIAPDSIRSGSVYFLSLPYGSFTPGEPAVGIDASFTMANASALVGTTLQIDARAGFQYGAVATGGTAILGGSDLVSDTVVLIQSALTVATAPGEGETATGPDFPVQYTLTIQPAPAIANTSTPVTNLSLSFLLPNSIIETGSPLASGGGTAFISSGPGGGGSQQTLNIAYLSLPATETVTFSAYVPENYQYTIGSHTAGTPILDPTTGAPVAITVAPAYTYAADPWNTLPVSGTGDVTGAVFEAKSLAVQLLENTNTALPTRDVTYTLNFQVSDYFGVQGLNLGATLGDGLTFDPSVIAGLSVTGKNGGVSTAGVANFNLDPATERTVTFADPVGNSPSTTETIQASGSGLYMAYAFDGLTTGSTATGQTTVTFNPGGLLPGQFGAGTTGQVTFAATVLDRYPTGVDHLAGAGGFLREADSVSTSSSAVLDHATSLSNFNGAAYTASGNQIADFTATQSDTLPQGTYSLTVVDVNGNPFTGQTISPGDTVVYEMTYTLAAPADFAALNLTAYVPEPVFSVLRPAAPDGTTAADFSGSGTSTFGYNGAAAASGLASGQYTYSLSSGLTGVTVTGATGVEPANSVTFGLADPTGQTYYNRVGDAGGRQTVTIDFAVTASHLPFVDGLHLTAQGDSSFTPAVASKFGFQTTQILFLNEPLLLAVQQGAVSVVNDSGTDISGTPGIGWTLGGAGASAPALFAPAGSANVFAPGAVVPGVLTPGQANLDVSGAQAGDTVRIVDVVQNAGHFAAYDVVLKDALSQAFNTGNVTNLTFTRGDGTVLETIDPLTGHVVTGAAAIADYFSTGLLLAVPVTHTAADVAAPSLLAAGSNADIVYATYDVTLPANTPTGSTLTGQATIVAWTNQDLYVTNGTGGYTLNVPVYGTDGNFANDPAIGATLTDTATVATVVPSITDTITGAGDGSNSGVNASGVPSNIFSTHNATVVPGETVNLSATITLPQGVNTHVTPIDILPAGLTLIGTPGTYTATFTDNTGHATDITAQVTFSGNTLSIPAANYTVPPTATGGDQPATITITYQALVPQTLATPIDTSGWSSATTGNRTLTDGFAAPNEGLGYTASNETTTATATASAHSSGVANTVTVTNPLVSATIAEDVSGNVYSGEAITYTLTLRNSSASATAYDLGSSVTLPVGLTYVAGSLTQTAGAAAADVTTGNVGVNGTAGAGNAVDGIVLAPGATSTFTFRATVNNDLPAATPLQVTARPAWESLPASATFDGAGNVNPQAQAYSGAPGSVSNSVAVIAPTLSIIGESNGTAGLGTAFNPTGTSSPAAVTAADSEIVRMRAVLQIPEGQNNAVSMTVTLPNGLTYENDGSTNVLLISPNGDFATSLTGTGLQKASGATVVDPASLGLGFGTSDLVATPLTGPGAIGVSGQTVTFAIGTLRNNDISPNTNYVVVEFNAVVADTTANNTGLTTSLTGTSGTPGTNTATVSDFTQVVAPVVTLTKVIDGIVYNGDGTATVTYTDTEKNSSAVPAYNVVLTDPGAGTGIVTYNGPAPSGNVTAAAVNGSEFDATITTLAGSNTTQSFTYSVTIPQSQLAAAVTDAAARATLTSYALNPALEAASGTPAVLHETLAGSSLLAPQHSATATAGLDLVSGSVNQDLSATQGADAPLQGLGGQTVTVSFPGQTIGTETVTTASNGNYTVLVPDHSGPVSVKVTTATPNAPTPDSLDNGTPLVAALPGATESGANPAVLTFTPAASTNYTNVAFDFWRPLDTAPVLAGGPAAALAVTAGTAIVPFASATAADAQLDGALGHDFSGTTLTLQRYAGNTPAPDGTDVFAATGTATSGLFLSNGAAGSGNVVLAGTTVGTYTESAGVLSIRFASAGVTGTTVDAVLNGINYISTAGGNATLPAIVIGAQIDDANNDPIALNGASLDLAGPHDQGPGGDLLSNVLKATVTVTPLAPGLSIIGSSNNTEGLGTNFDPAGQTAGTAVTTTGSEIVRMRAVVQLPEGTNSAAGIAVTLPNGLTYQNDGSTNVLLITPNGNAGTTLTGAGLQYAEGATPADPARLSLGTGSTDPVTAALNETGAIGVSGQTVTFNLGTVTNPSTAAGPNYVVVEFNAVVADTTAATTAPLSSAMHADTNGVSTVTVNDYVNVIAPAVTLTKTVGNIAYNPDGSATVTYVDTEKNNGNATAYNLSLDDPGAGPGNTVNYGGPGASGNVASVGPNGSHFDATVSTLAAGGTQTFTYSVTIPASGIATAVSDSTATATLTSYALNPAGETGGQETLAGTSLTPPQHVATAAAGLDVVSGTVNQDVAPASGTDAPLVGLEGQTVAVTFGGQTGTESIATGSTGHYAVLVPDSGLPVTLTVTVGSPNAPTPDTLDNTAALIASVSGSTESGANPATLTFTPAANTPYPLTAFDFWRPLDTAPVLANGPGAPQPELIGSPVVPFPNATVSDVQLDTSFVHDYSGTTLTLQRYIGPAAAPDGADVFTGTGTSTTGVSLSNGASGSGNILLAGVAIGTYTEASGVLTIRFAANGVTATAVDSVLQGIAYTSNLSGTALVPGIVIGARIDDANNDPVPLNGNALDSAGPHDQGPGGDLSSNVLTATINVHGAGLATTFTDPNDSNPAAAAVTVDATIDLANVAHTSGVPSQVTLAITNAHAEDVLTFTNTADITGTYSNGTLTLHAVSGHTPTLGEWQTAIRSVQYYDSSNVPNTATRAIDITLTSGANTATEQAGVGVVAVNDSPVLDSTVAVALNHATEHQGAGTPVPSGAAGTLVSQIARLNGGTPNNVTDPDGAGLSNGGVPAVPGIAITGFNTTDPGGRTVGTWYYSIDGGSNWTAFQASISVAHPLDLSSTARIAFQPTATDFNGQIPNAITFRAWDSFDGSANGTQANLTGVTAFGQSAANNTPATAYSIATDTLPLTIDNVNNAPDAVGAISLPPVSTSEQHPAGQTVGQLFNGGFSDPLDNQVITVANPFGSTSNGFAGVAITGNAATHNQGVWEYSLDGGTTWTAIPANVSQSNALILPANARIAFQPEGGFSGNPGQLSANLIDRSATAVAPGLTGAQLAAEGFGGVPLAALTGVDIPAVGGTSAFSATTMALGTLVNPLPPVLPSNPVFGPGGPIRSDFHDDLRHDPSGLEFWTTDDFLDRPLIPDLSLVGSVANRFVIETQHAVISVPSNIFQDSLPNAQLSYEAKLPDGSALPSWLTFNANDLTFSGTPPRGSYGRVEILIRARDVAGTTADATFNILIGREQQDLAGLMRPGHHGKLFLPRSPDNPASGRVIPRHEKAAADEPNAHPIQAADHVTAQAALLGTLPPPAANAGGFSAALHAAGPMSALGRARALLDTLDDMVRHKPAA